MPGARPWWTCFVEGLVGILTKWVVFEPNMFQSCAAWRVLQPSEYPAYHLPEPSSKHMKENAVVIECEFYKKWVSLVVHICSIVSDVCREAWCSDDPRAKYRAWEGLGVGG